MKRWLALAGVPLVLTGCSASAPRPQVGPSPSTSAEPSPALPPAASTGRKAAIYAAAIRHLVLQDSSIGRSGHIHKVYVADGPVVGAANPNLSQAEAVPRSRFSAAMKRAIAARLSRLPHVRFASKGMLAGIRKRGGRGGAALVLVAPVRGSGARALVGVNLWISLSAGYWQTQVVERTARGWTVTGTTGPSAIS
jgi:hypothetical protein